MKNIFRQTKEFVKPPKRNVFDLSFMNHGTYNFGTLYPVFCKPVLPGDSFKIHPSFALRFLPTAFPVQTKINASLHFFYVRNRNLWDDWTKFIGNTSKTEFPYINSPFSITTCSLFDYLSVPTTIVGKYGSIYGYDPDDDDSSNQQYLYRFVTINNGQDTMYRCYIAKDPSDPTYTKVFNELFNITGSHNGICTLRDNNFDRLTPFESFDFRGRTSDGGSPDSTFGVMFFGGNNGNSPLLCYCTYERTQIKEVNGYWECTYTLDLSSIKDKNGNTQQFDSFQKFVAWILKITPSRYIGFGVYSFSNPSQSNTILAVYSPQPEDGSDSSTYTFKYASYDNVVDLSDLPYSQNPFRNDGIRLNALPFRAYESIYNAFYRNEQNDPLIIDGQPEYDKYVRNTSGGADNYKYELYNRNWELDFMTSAVQSPQQGIAPLVGVSSSGDFTFVHKDSDGNIGYFSAKASIAADGKSISGVQLSDEVEISGLPTTPIVADIPEDVKRGSVYTLKQMALAGISINDFRNVNSLQRWLETNIRRGFKYKDQIKSHFGVDVAYNVLDMPEFIGGVNQSVFSSQVNQTTETESDPLGSYAGQLSLIVDSEHDITHYCDEHGYIIGIFCVTPVPNYSQVLPKDFIKNNYLDYYFPEFAHIGMQPIDYREVCPIQSYANDKSSIYDTFGYQRPWYDYISSVDEVHGLFRTNLRNFVLNRQFDTKPRLNKDFLQVDASQLNDIFTVQSLDDKILGQISFDVIAKRPIPLYGIPRLE